MEDNKNRNSFLSYTREEEPEKKLNFTRETSKPVPTQRTSTLFGGDKGVKREEPKKAPVKKAEPEQVSVRNSAPEEHVTLASIVAKKILGSGGQPKKEKPANAESKTKASVGISPLTIVKRVGASVGALLVIVLVFLIGVLLIVNRGPSIAFRDQFVMTVSESSAGDFLATWFLPDETVEQILKDNAIEIGNEVSTGDGVVIATPAPNQKDFEIVDVSGKTFTGKMIVVLDPSRVKIGTPPGGYGEDKVGMSTIDMAKHYNALAAVNGGGFYDTGKGNGGVPTGRENSSGIVISNGKMLWGSPGTTYEVIGINKEHKLVLGKMTGQQALDSGIVEALNFGPYLIMDGEPCVIGSTVTEGGLNPRTAIGQRADGAMLILVINGRQANSLGASYDDLISVMLDFGAVNAANLDGGSSSYMVYENEIITTCASLYGPRKMATSILVSR
ncbi:MAG: hypothetical protein E7388_04835 [Ruminococcaceae bacterium]|nr:hypothetical protein [Oscillospiraceae bacterium]